MAHQYTDQEVDQLATEEAQFDKNRIDELAADQAKDTSPTEPTLAAGAEGTDVTRLVNLLNMLGYNTNTVIKGGSAVLDPSVMADVQAAQTALAVAEPNPATVGPATFAALYEAVRGKLDQTGAAGA